MAKLFYYHYLGKETIYFHCLYASSQKLYMRGENEKRGKKKYFTKVPALSTKMNKSGLLCNLLSN